MEIPEIDPNFEPQARARSNTWPLRPKETIKEDEPTRSPTIDEHCVENNNKDPLGLNAGKKTGSRRNAWGNLSYADLITKAIQSTPEKRLTLSQIYDWMVQNVPYFKDKGDSNSSAGWKNSIRHNLSLHNRFMRIQNEGTGKSSWWVLNPDAKPGKAPRRRATSMDTKAYKEKRGRAKRKAEQLRALAAEGHSPTHHGSHDFVENGFIPEDSPLPFNLSPGDFRDRTSSNASSIGRLSPIQSALEPDLHDNQVPPSMSPIPWQGGLDSSYPTSQEGFNAETITESLAEMFVGENELANMSEGGGSVVMQSNLSTPSPVPQQLSPNSNGSINFQGGNSMMSTPPPPYPDHLRRSPQHIGSPAPMVTSNISTLPTSTLNFSGGTVTGGLTESTGSFMSQSMDVLQNNMYDNLLDQDPMLAAPSPSPSMQSISQFVSPSPSPQPMPQQPQQQPQQQQQRSLEQQRHDQLLQMLRSQPPESLLKQALTQRTHLALQRQQALKAAQMKDQRQRSMQQQQFLQHQQQQQQLQQLQQQQLNSCNGLSGSSLMAGRTSDVMDAQQIQGGLNAGNTPPNMPCDLDVNFSEMEAGNIECNVEDVLNHELSFDDCLDFNFEPAQQQSSQSNGDNPYMLQLSH